MNIIAFTTTYWNDKASADKQRDALERWCHNMLKYLKPSYIFMCAGTWSNPALNPVPYLPLINSGVRSQLPYDYFRRQYSICAFMAGCFHALNRDDWDIAVLMDYDAWIGNVNFPKLFAEFQSRPEIIMAPGWYDGIGGPMIVFKREGLARVAHYRIHPNLRDMDEPERPQVIERELRSIFGNRWWNPWPQFEMLVYHDPSKQDPIAQDWPFVDRAPAHLLEPYAKACTSKAVSMP